MQMDIFLLRHAETLSNQKGRLSSGMDDTLTALGCEQAHAIVSGLLSLRLDAILCSPLSRAVKTVQPFLDASSLPFEIHPCLAEGQLVLTSEVPLMPVGYQRLSSGVPVPCSDESPGAFLQRVEHAKDLLLSQQYPRILVVTHGHMIRELLNSFLALPSKTRFPHHNCGLTHLSIGEQVTVGFVNRPLIP